AKRATPALVKGVSKVEQGVEILAAVVGRLLEKVLLDEAKDHLADVVGRGDAPLGEDGAREEPELLHAEVAVAFHQLRARHVLPSLAAAPDREVERLEQERVRLRAVARVASHDLADDVV